MSLKDPNVVNPSTRKRVAMVISNPAISTADVLIRALGE
jgi:hypothetical protein